LGVPFNIASYALLAHLFAQQCDLEPGELVWTGGDCHLYLNHLEQAELQLSRTPFAPPRLSIRRRPPSIFDYRYEDFEFANYQHQRAADDPPDIDQVFACRCGRERCRGTMLWPPRPPPPRSRERRARGR